ncbi:MAG: hypothetical protein ACXVPW_18820, partial [Bacteroidia bacterium]
QLAYFKRNGMVLSGGGEIGSGRSKTVFKAENLHYDLASNTLKDQPVLEDHSQECQTAKYVKDVKQDVIVIDQKTVDAIIEQLTPEIERRITQEAKEQITKLKEELIVKYESLIVKYKNELAKENFTSNDEAETTVKQISDPLCNAIAFNGITRAIKELPPEINYCNPSEEMNIKDLSIAKNTQNENAKEEVQHFTIAETEHENTKDEKREIIPIQKIQPKKKPEEEYKWIESQFIKSLKKKYHYSDLYLNGNQNADWVSERLVCLLESLIRLSNYSTIDKHTLLCITDAFNKLIKSNAFKNLPDDYNYTKLIQELSFKLNSLLAQNKYSGRIKFNLSFELKTTLIINRVELFNSFPEPKFSELDFTEEKNTKEQALEDENEKQATKKGWQLRYEEMKRKQLREAA